MLLPSVCEALVLVTQCLITFALTSEDEEFEFPPGDNPKDFLNSAMVEEGVGMPEIVISAFRSILAHDQTRPQLFLQVSCKGLTGCYRE